MRALAVLFALPLFLGACGQPTSSPSGSDQTTAPDFTIETFEGDTFQLARQRGMPVVLNFWESW